MTGKGTEFRRLALRTEGIFLIGVDSPIGAIVAEKAIKDYKAKHGSSNVDGIYVGGFAAAGIHGWPDMEIFKGEEMYRHMRGITRVATLPMLADADTGYGGINDTIRTVIEYFKVAGVTALHIEDQVTPKRCGHIAGKEVLPLEEFLGKLKAAIDTRNSIDKSLPIVARTDAYNAAGFIETPGLDGDLEEVVKRAKKFIDIGADSVWVEFPNPQKKSFEAFARAMEGHLPPLGLAFNVSSSFRWHTAKERITRQELNQMGAKILFNTYQIIAEKAVHDYDLVSDFCQHGDPGAVLARRMKTIAGHPMESFKEVVGVKEYQNQEAKYSAHARTNLETSKGFKIGDKETL